MPVATRKNTAGDAGSFPAVRSSALMDTRRG